MNGGNAKINECDTTIDVVNDTGIIVGANVQATSNLCLASSAGKGAYKRCMEVYKRKRLSTAAPDRRPCGAGFFG